VNDNGIRRFPNGDVVISAPPATARGDAPLPGSLVSTPARIAAPMATLNIPVPMGRFIPFMRLLFEFFGDEFDVQLNTEVMAALSAEQWRELQALTRREGTN
jgi:hypothetical protein